MAKEKKKEGERQKAKTKGFAALGVPVGAVLTYRKDPTITATVVDEKNKVEYEGKVYPISGLAKKLMETPISGYHAFKYNGILLAKLGDSKMEAKPAAEIPAQAPVKPAVAPETPAPPTPQIVPLPKVPEAATPPQEDIDPLKGQPPDDGEI